ncbi:Hsp70 family protein [Pseudorhodobacter sp.]|uniref:Hsp70 family protein n=1 Tax=Pseudorhodobacter sp. TaxID=1934400 RepID=UPI002649A492|nr:Hsp70 family protein [Pseudorhodobacter sp.]MDN5787692.1 Hsp70 family protein [Pseudorhodobacter sp.]
MAEALQVCGVDFGTSNSTVSVMQNGRAQLIALESGSVTLPSAVFWDADGLPPVFGRAAIAAYTSGEDGRLMRGLKSALGSSLIHEKTRLGTRSVAFTDILGRFIGHMRDRLEAVQPGTRHVVMGRPVHFVENDAEGDRAAQNVLEQIARDVGFEHIAFQFEPIAAALHYESSVDAEELVLIVDIGGGTSDFSILRVSPEGRSRADRDADILGSHGIRVGGTDFDRLLSLTQVMPTLGLGSLINKGKTPMPMHYYIDLATWHRINFLYAGRALTDLGQIKYDAAEPVLIDRLIRVIEKRRGHSIAMAVEAAKIELSETLATPIRLADMIGVDTEASRTTFETAVAKPVNRISDAIAEVLARAGLRGDQIGTVFMTGGSSSLPTIQDTVRAALPGVRLATGDLLGSVGTGLALDAARRFA